MLDLDELASELSLHGYRRYWCLELHCCEHGDIRVCADAEPESWFGCPICNRMCPSVWLGRGLSDEKLPTWERCWLSRREAHAVKQARNRARRTSNK